MTKRKTDKKIHHLEPSFQNILVCKKNDCRPFLEALIEEPENISHQNLGILAGIFQIDDRSEDSSYVVNYLISIIKKEYFSRANRGPVENFESALHKANLALAKLASHENIGWIGHINAICAVIEKNNLLLSQTGNASAFLLRGSTLTEITELPNENTTSNPLKTFQDVISGKIEKNDKLLFTTKEIFDIFSLEELKKSALKFSREDFLRFLNTALINELDQVAVLVVDINEKIEEPLETPIAKKIEDINIFSQTAFRKEPSGKKPEKEKQELIRELEKKTDDFVDKKTGHIYIRESKEAPLENTPAQSLRSISFLEKTISKLNLNPSDFLDKTKKIAKNSVSSFWEKGHKKISEIRSRKEESAIKKLEKKIETQIEAEAKTKTLTPERQVETETKKPDLAKIETPLLEKIRLTYSKLEIRPRMIVFLKVAKTGTSWLKEKSADGLILVLKKPTRLVIKLTAISKNKWQEFKAKKAETKNTTDYGQKKYPWEKASPKPISCESETAEPIDALPKKIVLPVKFPIIPDIARSIKLKKILPSISHLKQIISKFDRKQKISLLIVLVLLLVVPYFIANWESSPKEETILIEEAPTISLPLEEDLNVTRVEKLNAVYSSATAKIVNLNNKLFALSETKITGLEDTKNFSLPDDFQNPEMFFGMEDLNLLFLIKNNKITSLSPTTGKFQNNNLSFPDGGKIVDAKTYLTYIYLLDTNNNQIYRAPRAEGGFGEKIAWLKDNIELSQSTNLAINENIFVIEGQNILKLFQGKKQIFAIKNTATPIIPAKLYAQNNGTTLYILDKTNARIIKLNNEGDILTQYHNTDIANATDFSVSEDNGLIYLSDTNGVKSFGMNQE